MISVSILLQVEQKLSKGRRMAYDGCRVTAGAQATQSGVPTVVAFGGADFDTVPPYWLQGAGQPEIVQVPFAGKFRVQATVVWGNLPGAGVLSVKILLNGNVVLASSGHYPAQFAAAAQ